MANVKKNLPKILKNLGCENVKKENGSTFFSKMGKIQKWDMEIELSEDFPLNPPEIILQKHCFLTALCDQVVGVYLAGPEVGPRFT